MKLIVDTPCCFKKDDSFNDERFMRVRIAVLHSGENKNNSSIDTKVIKAAKDSFSGIAILANVKKFKDENGEEHYDYSGHDMHIEEDAFNDGKMRVIYDERVVGFIPEKNNFEIVHDDERNVDFAYVDGLIYRTYGNYCADILEARGGQTEVSAELYADEVSVNAETQVLNIEKMTMSGVTLLGEHVRPAMKGANASVFSISDDDRQAQLIAIMQELTQSLDNYAAAISGKISEEGGTKGMDKFNELLEQYGKTAEDITFEYEGLSDEELEAKFAELFSSSEPEAVAEPDPEPDESKVCYTATFEGRTVQMSVSLQDKISALYKLVNDTYGDDDTWYDVTVYDDDKYVIMIDYWRGKGYKQSYKVKKDTYTLVGDRVEVFARWLTQDEIDRLEKMKADYADATEKLGRYEDEPKKLDILNSEDYSLIANDEEFVALKEQKNHFELSVEEVANRADAILTKAAKERRFTIGEPVVEQQPKPLPHTARKPQKRFGSLFDGIIK